MSTISTHVLDTSLGKPAQGVRVTLERDHSLLGSGVTDEDGRVRELMQGAASLAEGEYPLTFAVGDYFAGSKRSSLSNKIVVNLQIGADAQHYHIPLLLSPFAYSTYRGS